MYNDTSLQPPTSVTLDGQTATLIDSAGTTNTVQVAEYKVTGFSTGSGKTLGWTVGSSGIFFGMNFAIEYRDGSPTYGDHASSAQPGSGPASTRGIANTSGDELVAAYCAKDTGGDPTMGAGQTKQDQTDDATGLIYYGFTTETGAGSADVQSVATGGSGQQAAIASVAITTAAVGGFSVAPIYATVSNTAISATFTATAASQTYYCALYAPGATAPTAVQLQAGTGAHSSVVTGSTTGSSESHNMTASDSPTFPKYDPYCVINSGTVATTSTTQTTPPTTCGAAANEACQYVTLSSVAIGGIASVATLAYDAQTANFVVGETVTGTTSGAVALVQADTDAGSTGTLTLYIASGTFQDNESITGNVNGVAVVNGTATYIYAVNDVLVAPTKVQPGNVTLTIASDGNAIYSTTGVQTATNVKIYDYSAVAYASSDIDWVNNDTPPTCPGDAIPQNLVKNQAMTAFDWDTLCTDAESDTLNSIAVGTQPTGVALNGTTNVVSGTPTVVNSGVTVKYVVYDTYGAIGFRPVLYTVVSVVYKHSPDCVTVPTGTAPCETLYETALLGAVTFSTSSHCSNSVDTGFVISTSPKPLADIPTGSNVSINTSLGACSTTQTPMMNCLQKTLAQCQALITAAFGAAVTLVSTVRCPAGYPSTKIWSQTPRAGTLTTTPATLTVDYCT